MRPRFTSTLELIDRSRMMTRDDRFYAFIVARTSRSRAHIRRICVHKRWLRLSAVVLVAVAGGLLYWFYSLTQQAEHLRIENNNQRLRAENKKHSPKPPKLTNPPAAAHHTSS